MRLIKKVIRKFSTLFFTKKPIVKERLDQFRELGLIHIGNNSDTKNIHVEIRKRIDNKQFLSIGEESVISGSFFFENENGVISIGDRTFIGGGGKFISINNISIGNDVLISWGCTFMDNNGHSLVWNERKDDVKEWKKGLDENKEGHYKDWSNVQSLPIIIEDKVWIGFEVVILKGVRIGEGAVIGSRSVVTKDVPKWTIMVGNPAQAIREIPENER
ncbi:acyltransferase [Flavivirga rizhaonensis]|uniref:Acyltransferase n=1 Tax=Flavivirga rizhaonensis TaxID=2559571 RepID=A0A4S1E1M0_9FLAO|nr:acyltransferase [Flavivirga rizhaonensis]TGV04409.1 acyltransferase [Flavivirga rizhaonensis]